jgi:single-strand DNA-binding protein
MTTGDAVTNFTIATSEKWTEKSGEKQEKSEFHNCVAFKKLAEICGEYLKKASQVYIEGKLTTEKWEKDGVMRYSTKIIIDKLEMLGSRQSAGESSSEPQSEHHEEKSNGYAPKDKPKAGGFDDFDSDIPFRESCLHYGLWRSI